METKKKNFIKILIRYAGLAIVIITVFYLGKNLYDNWNQIRGISWKPNLMFLSISFSLEMFVQIIGVYFWTVIIKFLGAFLTLRKAMKIWFVSSLGRYLPGKAWQLLGMMWFLSKEGVPAEISVASSLFVQVYSLIPGVLLSSFALVSVFNPVNRFLAISILIAGSALTLAISHPLIAGRIISSIAKKRGREISISGISPLNSFLILTAYLFYWILRGTAFYFFIRSFFTPVGIELLPLSVSVFSASYISGLLFLLAPGGVGVRESIMLKMMNLALGVPLGIASGLAIMNRIWLSFIEIICLIIGLAVNRRKNDRKKEE